MLQRDAAECLTDLESQHTCFCSAEVDLSEPDQILQVRRGEGDKKEEWGGVAV